MAGPRIDAAPFVPGQEWQGTAAISLDNSTGQYQNGYYGGQQHAEDMSWGYGNNMQGRRFQVEFERKTIHDLGIQWNREKLQLVPPVWEVDEIRACTDAGMWNEKGFMDYNSSAMQKGDQAIAINMVTDTSQFKILLHKPGRISIAFMRQGESEEDYAYGDAYGSQGYGGGYQNGGQNMQANGTEFFDQRSTSNGWQSAQQSYGQMAERRMEEC